jgi:hypothetical protein
MTGPFNIRPPACLIEKCAATDYREHSAEVIMTMTPI